MKLTSARTATTVTLVDSAISGYTNPLPGVSMSGSFDQYQPEGGRTRYVPHGVNEGTMTPQSLVIERATNELARAVFRTLRGLIADITEQPFTVQWDDNLTGGDDDGLWWIFGVTAAEVEDEFEGRIVINMPMAPADPADVGPSAVAVQVDGVQVGRLTAMRITIG